MLHRRIQTVPLPLSLTRSTAMSPEQFERSEVRRAVMGDAFVERALANLDDFPSRPLQELVTGYAWGEI